METPALKWAKSFAESVNRALDGDVYGWELLETGDPLKRVLHLQLHRPFMGKELPFVRALLIQWADINDSAYKKSEWKGIDFWATIYLRGLGPEMDFNPYNEDHVADYRRRRGRLGGPSRTPGGRGYYSRGKRPT